MEKRITYVSRFAKPMTGNELDCLGDDAAEKNRGLDVTGILMASGGLFYQVLEGPTAAVDELYATIVDDERHTDLLQLRNETEIDGRLFPEWSMKTFDLEAATHVRLLPLKALVKSAYEHQRLLDNMIWAVERTLQYEIGAGQLA